MNVWYMNFKDNRGEGIPDATTEKYKRCMKENFAAIGWARAKDDNESSYIEENRKHYESIGLPKSYDNLQNVFSKFKSMDKGDLVLFRNPKDRKYYIFLVAEKDCHITTKKCLNDIDIGCYKKCDVCLCIGTAHELKKQDFDIKRVGKRRTIQPIRNPEIQEKIINIFEVKGTNND